MKQIHNNIGIVYREKNNCKYQQLGGKSPKLGKWVNAMLKCQAAWDSWDTLGLCSMHCYDAM